MRPKGMKNRRKAWGLETFYGTMGMNARGAQIEGPGRRLAREAAQSILADIPSEATESLQHVLCQLDFSEGEDIDLTKGAAIARKYVWLHNFRGIAILGDCASATVIDDVVTKMSFCWHDVTPIPDSDVDFINREDAAHAALKEAASKTKASVDEKNLRDIDLVYYGFQDWQKQNRTFMPVWQARFVIDGRIWTYYVNASSGKVLPPSHIAGARRIVVK